MGEQYVIMTGNEACARGALDAGLKFFAGYPITPATEIAEQMSELLPKNNGVFMQMEDELGAIAATIGASTTGCKAMTATSGPGYALMQEGIGYAMIAEIPVVICDVQRQGPCQGVATVPAQGDIMNVRWGVSGDHPSIVVSPCSVSESYTEIIRAFNMAEKYRTPVIVISDATLAHMSEKVRLIDKNEVKIVDREKPQCKPEDYVPYELETNNIQPLASYGDGYRHLICGLNHDETGFPISNNPNTTQKLINHITGKIDSNIRDIQSWEEYLTEDADVIVLAIGIVARSAKHAVDEARAMGIKAGMFRPITVWPFPGERLTELCRNKKGLVTAEMNMGQLKEVAKEYVDMDMKLAAVTQSNGCIVTADRIVAAIKESAENV